MGFRSYSRTASWNCRRRSNNPPAAAEDPTATWWLGTFDPSMGGVGIGAGGGPSGPRESDVDEGRAGVHDLVDGSEGRGYWPDGNWGGIWA